MKKMDKIIRFPAGTAGHVVVDVFPCPYDFHRNDIGVTFTAFYRQMFPNDTIEIKCYK